MDKNQLKLVLEALIFASDAPITLKQLASILTDVSAGDLEGALSDLATDYKPRALMLKKVSGGYQFTTKPEYVEWVGQMFEERARSRLSRAALESLAIIAFKQPISRVEVSAIRGVNSEGVIKKLLDARLITISGRDSGPGRALLFKTTPEFLQYFGVNDISDLPRPKEVEELLAEGEGGALLQEIPDELLLTPSADQGEDQQEEPKAESLQKVGEKEQKGKDAAVLEDDKAADASPPIKNPDESTDATSPAGHADKMKEMANNAPQ